MVFLQQRIDRVAALVDGEKIRLQGTIDHCYAVDGEGRRWFRKRDADTGPESMVAEAVCWLIAAEIGAPVPRAAVFGEGTPELSWLSSVVEPMVHWQALYWPRVSNQQDLGAVIALDAVTLNEDRHQGNILLEPLPGGDLRLWAIDSGMALIGRPSELAQRVKDVPKVTASRPVMRGPIALDVRAAAVEAARMIAKIPPSRLGDFAVEASLLVRREDAPDAAALAHLLAERCRHAETLTDQMLRAIGEVT